MLYLYGIAYSPWTAKARWALDHHKIPYSYREHLILFGMPELRWRLKRPCGDLTVPLLFNAATKESLMDSFEIAKHIDVTGSGKPLFPKGKTAEIREINRLSETCLDAARALTISRVLKDTEAQEEALPKFLPGKLRPWLRWMAPIGIGYIRREFDVDRKTLTGHEEDYRLGLNALLEKLKQGGGDYILGDFSFADIAGAAALQGVEPVTHDTIPMAPATRRAWRHAELSKEYADLVQWRDRLFAKHR